MACYYGRSETGLVTRLTIDQYDLLKRFWYEFLKLIDSAPETGTNEPTTATNSDRQRDDQSNLSSSSVEKQKFSNSSSSILLNGSKKSDRLATGDTEEVIVIPSKDGLIRDEVGDEIQIKTKKKNVFLIENENDENVLKERLRSEQELKDARAALIRYGKHRFMSSFWDLIMMDDPDVIILKFLRARKWNVSAGVAMMASCMKWRIEYGVDELLRNGEDGNSRSKEFINQIRLGKAFAQGTDRQGRPIVYINVRLHKPSEQSYKTIEDFTVYCMEAVRLMLTPPLIEKATIVFDMTGFGLVNMDWKSLPFIIKCLEAYYPESLHLLLVHNPPWVFHGIWKVIAPMLDPIVREKVKMTKSKEDLKAYIDEKHLIPTLGGTNKFSWSFKEPTQQENFLNSMIRQDSSSSPSPQQQQNSSTPSIPKSSSKNHQNNAKKISSSNVNAEENKDFKEESEIFLKEKSEQLRKRQKMIEAFLELTKEWCTDPTTNSNENRDLDQKRLVSNSISNKKDDEKDEERVLVVDDRSKASELRRFVMYNLRVQFFNLDPYIRSRTNYHRNGLIIGNGLVIFEYPKVKPSQHKHKQNRKKDEKSSSKSKNKTMTASSKNKGLGQEDGEGEEMEDFGRNNDEDEDGFGSIRKSFDMIQVLGNDFCRETILDRIELMKRRFQRDGIEYPKF
ncbi:hypothetical protein BY996DRAFT_4642558 [Phakopsora pachyrhizi]|uniref:CRAL-TRIO domain-containing protein n=1 Tax=Phakopsora pachyrhizi TaxID=170000 RepID=A0AAV0BRL7_PHAPC|nr:hypothetical protein BY996DRAFT_4642558 [Phakopsora pachyrhizi]CAH7689190.1 hypothetical protein PPACK8108_LOCUS24246 [Phakopsora pachyrhizi]